MDKVRNQVSCIAADEVISTQTQQNHGGGHGPHFHMLKLCKKESM